MSVNKKSKQSGLQSNNLQSDTNIFYSFITLLGRHLLYIQRTYFTIFWRLTVFEKMRMQVTIMQGHTVLTFPGLRFGNRLTDMPIKDK